MSVQQNQYVIYGIRLPYSFKKEWESREGKDFYDTYEVYIEDSAFTENIGGKDGIFCLFDGMSGHYIIIGEVLAKSSDGEDIGIFEVVEREQQTEIELRQKIHEIFHVPTHQMPNKCSFFFINHFR